MRERGWPERSQPDRQRCDLCLTRLDLLDQTLTDSKLLRLCRFPPTLSFLFCGPDKPLTTFTSSLGCGSTKQAIRTLVLWDLADMKQPDQEPDAPQRPQTSASCFACNVQAAPDAAGGHVTCQIRDMERRAARPDAGGVDFRLPPDPRRTTWRLRTSAAGARRRDGARGALGLLVSDASPRQRSEVKRAARSDFGGGGGRVPGNPSRQETVTVRPVNVRRLSTAEESAVNQAARSDKELINKHVICVSAPCRRAVKGSSLRQNKEESLPITPLCLPRNTNPTRVREKDV